jgi:deoxyribonuclease V
MVWYRKREKAPAGLLKKLTQEQKALREKIILKPLEKPIQFIAGCDSAFKGDMITSIFVIFTFPELIELEVVSSTSQVTLPYIPGFLAFREIPNLLLAYKKLKQKPDLIMVDGQGIMHPRRMGIGAHLGIVLNLPTIGIAKSKLVGEFHEPGLKKGDYTEVFHKQEMIGYCLRSKDNIKPLFISPGHLCDMKDTLHITLNTLKKHKLPEPTRIADKYSKELK